MTTFTAGNLTRYLRHMLRSWEHEERTDAELLTLFARDKNEQAFATLVRRYSVLVWGVCHRVLSHREETEDAFQATFLVLARKAGQIGRKELVGHWLYRVAHHTASDMRKSITRRHRHEKLVSTTLPTTYTEDVERSDLLAVLDEEIMQLPTDCRLSLILCRLEGQTYAEAARSLGCSTAAVGRRVARAEELLRDRLIRRGVTLAGASVAALLSQAVTAKGMSVCLVGDTIRAAQSLANSPLASNLVVSLAQGVMQSMVSTKAVLWVAVLATLTGAALGLVMQPVPQAQGDASQAASPPPPAPSEGSRRDCYGDPLPAEALARMGTTRLRHMADVYAVFFAPDGKMVATREIGDTVRLWDVATGKLVRSLKHPAGASGPQIVSFAGDGKVLASANHNQMWLWNVATGTRLRELKINLEGEQQANSWAVTSDGKLAASGGMDAAVRLWDMASGNQLRVLQGKGKSIDLLCFSPDNKTLASMCEDDDRVVQLWDVSIGKLLHKLKYPQDGILRISFSPDGKTLASAGIGKLKPPQRNLEDTPSPVQLWDVATGKRLRTLQGHNNAIVSLSFSPDGRLLASGSWDKTIRLWDVSTGKELRKLKCPLMSAYGLAFAPDGKVLASAGTVPAVRLWEVATGKQLHPSQGAHTGQVQSVAFSPDGRTLITGAGHGEGEDAIRLWDAASGKPLRKLSPSEGVHAVVLAPDGKTLASAKEGTIRLWDAATGKQLRQLKSPDTSTRSGLPMPLAFSPDSKLLATGVDNGKDPSSNGSLQLWDVATGASLHALETPHQVASAAFSPDGKTLAVGTWGATLHLWDTVTGKERLKLDKSAENRGVITALSFSPDGKTLALNNKFCLLEVSSGRELHTLTGHKNQVTAVAFSPSGRWLASAGEDWTVRLWEVNAGLAVECHQFRGHDAWVSSVAFSPDGRRLASGSCDSTALVWDVTGLLGKQGRAPRLTNGELTACWQSLISMDAAQAYQALRTLAASPDQTVPFLAGRLFLKKPDPQQVARLLAELDSEEFRVRSQAAKELAKLGEAVEPALQRALRDNPSVEVSRRIQHVLEALDPPHPEGVSPRLLRWLRAVEVLEWIGNPAARELLEKVAAAPPREEVGLQAEAALKRLRVLVRP